MSLETETMRSAMQLRFDIPFMLALCFVFSTPAFGQFTTLTGRVHKGSNAVVGINAAALKETELAQKQGWSKKLEAAYVDRATFLPPEAEMLMIASQLVPSENFQQNWELALMTLSEPLSMKDVARAEGGYVDEINGKEAVWTPSDAYVVSLDPKIVGIVHPANRQAISSWIEEAEQNNGDGMSEYLQLALAKVTAETQIVMAIDLKDAVSPHLIEQRWSDSETIEKTTLEVEDVVSLIESIQGATIELSIGSSVQAKSRVDFQKPVVLSDANAKRLILETLERLGSQIDDFADHKYSVLGKSIIVEGDLSKGGLRRLLSVLEIPTTKFSELEDESTDSDKTPSAGDMAENSQVYFKSVTSLLDDIHGTRDRKSYEPVWQERYARKIDRLPILYVDEDLLDYGSKTAQTLRYMAGVKRDSRVQTATRQSSVRSTGGYSRYSYDYNGAGYGYRNNNDNLAAQTGGLRSAQQRRSQIATQERGRANLNTDEGWRLIDNATADIRKVMTQRYGVEF